MSDERNLQQDDLEPAPEVFSPVEEPAEAAEGEVVAGEDLAASLAAATQKAQAHWDQLLRTQAEMENLRRRTEKELQSAHKFALEKFARDLLPVIDSLELGVQAASGEGADVVKLREGSELTLKQFRSVLEKFNVLSVDPLGQKFNPDLHQAMAMEPGTSVEPNTVVKVFQKGYVLNERLLRPAMVVISQAVADQPHLDEKA